MGNLKALCSALFVATLIALPATAAEDFTVAVSIPAPRDVAYPGTITLHVDATNTAQRIFNIRETIPASPGPLTLLFPQWLPANHAPRGPIDKLSGLVVRAGGQRLEWRRDPVEVYAFHVNVPQGASSIDLEFQFVTPTAGDQGRIVMTPEMLNLQWNAVVLYPAGYYASRIPVEASVTLPEGWQLGTALETASAAESVTKFKPGDRVMARTRGSHATKVLAEARKTHLLPLSMTFEDGAAVPVGWHTAWHALVTVANVQPGQKVLIEAVASSVGSAALQIAKHRGCWVGGTASRDDKLALAKPWGCDAVYNYKSADWSTCVLTDTGGNGIDVSCATMGAETIQALLDCMGQEGKVINYGSTSGIVITYNLRIGERNISLHSMSIDSSPKYVPITLPTFEAQAIPMFASGGYKAVVGTVLPMIDLPRAHEMIHERRHFGKIIMRNG